VPTVRAQRQRLCPTHRMKRQFAIEMREQRAAAGWFPFECRAAERVGSDRTRTRSRWPVKCFAAVSAT
jgi:hypothetical protein